MSWLLVSDVTTTLEHPERVVAGHPYNPPYLVPLVELTGGMRTSPAAIDWAADFYRYLGKRPLVMEREVSGFVANRLQAALGDEADRMLRAGEATIEQNETAIADGPGLRWAFYGPYMTSHLANSAGIRGTMARFRSDSPDLEREDRVAKQVETFAGHRSLPELLAERDAAFVELLILKAQRGHSGTE